MNKCSYSYWTLITQSQVKKYNRGDLYFGNTEGRDFLKGKNIDVIGTPHQSEWIYKLFAYSIGCKFDTEAKIKPGITVEHNGYRFRFTTYEDEVLRAIQFYIIESHLEQAVGRARLLRCACTVNLYSNFPLSQAKIITISTMTNSKLFVPATKNQRKRTGHYSPRNSPY